MKADKIVHFNCFETRLNLSTEQFFTHWEQYTRSEKNDAHVILQRSQHNGLFKYIAQHQLISDGTQFVFEKARRSSRVPEMEIKATHFGGYSVSQLQRKDDVDEDESKVFAFLNITADKLEEFKRISDHAKLNIYEAYYENCRYAYILEFFVSDEYVTELMEQLKLNKAPEIGAYHGFALQGL